MQVTVGEPALADLVRAMNCYYSNLIDQVSFMESLVQPDRLRTRISALG